MTIIEGKNINLRLVEIDDADFILSLRLEKGKFLSNTNPSFEEQKKWIKLYKERESLKQEYYFIIENKDSLPIGTVRIYDFKFDSFCWGSWVIKNNSPYYFSIESVMLVYEFAFQFLNFKNSHFDVRKDNDSVVSFHKRFGAKIIKEDELDYFFNFSIEDYQISKIKYKKFLIQNEK